MRTATGLTIGGAASAAGLAPAQGNAPEPQRAIADPPSGRHFATAEALAMQDDDVRNPAMLRVEEGGAAWRRAEGAAAPPIDSRALDAITTGLALPSRGMPMGGEEFTDLGCCLAWRAQGLPVESPSVRR